MSKIHIQAIDSLVVEKGTRKEKLFTADLTTKDIAERTGRSLTETEFRLIMNVVKTAYPNTTFERANGDAGWLLHFRIRVK